MTAPARLRRAGLMGAVVGLAAAGVAAGIATERYLVRKARLAEDPYAEEPFGELEYDERIGLSTAEGVDVHVEVVEADEPSDATVVLVHGFCLDMGTFHFQRRHLDGRHRMVLYDQPGHGRSGRLPKRREYTLEALGSTLRAVVERAAPTGRLVLVGHSMGGMTIMALAEECPDLFRDRVAGVVLVSTSAGRLDEVDFGLPEVVARFRRPLLPVLYSTGRVTAAMLDRARRASTDLAWLLTRRYGFGSARPSPSLVSYVERMNSTTSVEVMARYLRTLHAHSRLIALEALREVPVLVVIGDTDVLTPLAHSEEIVQVLPDAELVVVEHGGHVVLLEHAEQVNEALDRFLAKVL